MFTLIKCPQCGHEFEPNEPVREAIEKELRTKMIDWQKQKEKQLEIQFSEEKNKFQQELEENLRRNIFSDYENKLRMLEENNKINEGKLKEARRKELEFLQKEQQIKTREEELEIQIQKKVLEERIKLAEQIRKEESEKISLKETEYQMRQKELEKQLEDQKKLADEMKRKAEQGSMQLQGAAQELALVEILRAAFPFDIIIEVNKGVRGADCIQTVRNNFGQECGKIIYESKRTNLFGADWIEKLKTDMRTMGAEIAVIVTRAMPKDMDCFGIKDGVWICTFSEVRALASVLREGVVRVFNTTKSNENKGDKMHLLYGYLTSHEFAGQWKAIREGFMSMKLSIQREKDAMEKLWKAREKQLEKVLLNAAHIRGSIEGISGNDVDLNLLENSPDEDDIE